MPNAKTGPTRPTATDGPEDWAALEFVKFERALAAGDLKEAADNQARLRQLGFDVRPTFRSPS